MNVFEKIISIIAPFRCLGCGIDGKLICSACANEFIDFEGSQEHNFKTYALYEYDGLASDLVRALKFDQAQGAAEVIAQQLHERLPRENWDIVTYLPTAPKRARQRGYDQAKLIAKHFAQLRGLEFTQTLTRSGRARQVGSTKLERQRQLAGAFNPSRTVLNEHVLIIDDVMTTGSSLNEAASVLRSSGARRIDCAVFAAKK